MKQLILYLLVIVFSMGLYAQGTELTINVSPGKLKDAMTENQMKTVTTLTLTGEMDNSDFYTIRDHMKKLKQLDLSEAVADTIPVKAFRNTYISYFILTKELKCIQDSAFSKIPWLHGIEFMGEFPTLGKDVFDESRQPQFTVGEDNTACKIINNYVYSWDITVLYLAPKDADEYMEHKTKQISSFAFDGCFFKYGRIHIPESVDFIGDHAFNNIQANWPVGSGNFSPITVTCAGLVPPVLGEGVFSNQELSSYTLNVPMESLELYKSSPQWGMFGTIEGYLRTSLIINVSPGKLKDAMTDEQMKTVTTLTLTGEMDNSDFYTIRDHMRKLEKLDLSKVIADTIPEYGLYSMPNLRYLDFPATLVIIDKCAFEGCMELTAITWWNYPLKIMDRAFRECWKLIGFYTSEDNPDCVSVNGVLFSKDRKKLLRFPTNDVNSYVVPNNTEIIGKEAFGDALVGVVTLPESVNYIEEKAFWVTVVYPTGNDWGYALSELKCESCQPAILEGDPFLCKNNTKLTVPTSCQDIYANTPIWKNFVINNGASLECNQHSPLDYKLVDNTLYINSEQVISKVELLDFGGNVIGAMRNQNDNVFRFQQKLSLGVYLVGVTYQDGSKDVIKVVKWVL